MHVPGWSRVFREPEQKSASHCLKASTAVGCWSGAPPGALHAQPVNAPRYNKPFWVSIDGALSVQVQISSNRMWSRSLFTSKELSKMSSTLAAPKSTGMLIGIWRKASHHWLGERGTSLWRAAGLMENTCSPDKDIAQTSAILEGFRGWAWSKCAASLHRNRCFPNQTLSSKRSEWKAATIGNYKLKYQYKKIYN